MKTVGPSSKEFVLQFSQVIRRKVVVPADNDFEQPFKVTLNKKSKKDGMSLCIIRMSVRPQ